MLLDIYLLKTHVNSVLFALLCLSYINEVNKQKLKAAEQNLHHHVGFGGAVTQTRADNKGPVSGT